MKLPRVYYCEPLKAQSSVSLTGQPHQHISRVLRKKQGQFICLFDGFGQSITAEIALIEKRQTLLNLQDDLSQSDKPSLDICLGQVMAKGDKMDFIVQKATELGVNSIHPLRSSRCDVRLDAQREQKRLQHWNNIAIAACEQSGRNWLPEIHPVAELNEFCKNCQQADKYIMHPLDIKSEDNKKNTEKSNRIALLVGPEGGFSEEEINQALELDFMGMRLGKNVLRTETAALAATSAIQFKYEQWQF